MIKFEMEILELNLFSLCTLPVQLFFGSKISTKYVKLETWFPKIFVPYLKEGVKMALISTPGI